MIEYSILKVHSKNVTKNIIIVLNFNQFLQRQLYILAH